MSRPNLPGVPTDVAPRAWYRVENRARAATDTETAADVYIYDAIGGWWGVEASSFVAELAALDVDRINLFVNSPGGDVYDAVAMTNALRRHRAHVVATVDGLAASAASFLITAADEVVMGPNSELMIHDAWGIAIGNAADMRDSSSRLDAISDNIASMYAAQAGEDVATWRALMLAETWYSADEAVAAGLADRVEGAAVEDSASARFDLSVFAHAGRAQAPAPLTASAVASVRARLAADPTVPPESIEGAIASAMLDRRNERPAEPGSTNTTNQRGVARMDDITTRFRNRLGIPADAVLTEDQLVEALDEALNELAPAAPAAAAAAAVPEGTVLIDSAQLDELRSQATLGAEARAQQVADRRDGIVRNAINEGRIPPARAEQWRAQLDADEEGATGVLNSLAAGTIPLAAKGQTGGVENSADDDALFHKVFASVKAADTQKGA